MDVSVGLLKGSIFLIYSQCRGKINTRKEVTYKAFFKYT